MEREERLCRRGGLETTTGWKVISISLISTRSRRYHNLYILGYMYPELEFDASSRRISASEVPSVMDWKAVSLGSSGHHISKWK